MVYTLPKLLCSYQAGSHFSACLELPDLGENAPPFEVISDACGTGLGCALLQDQRPIAFGGRKLHGAETRYSATEQELLGVIFALKKWRCYLEGTSKPFVMVTDHAPNTYFSEQPKLSARQARWSEILASYNFQWLYRPGKKNLADPLSRHPAFAAAVTRSHATQSKDSSLPRVKRTRRAAIGSEATASEVPPMPTVNLHDSPEITASDWPSHPAGVPTNPGLSLIAQICEGYAADRFIAKEQEASAGGKLNLVHGQWKHKDAFYVPDVLGLRASVIREHHAPAHAGHPGVARTQELVQRSFWWPSLLNDVSAYVCGCVPCQRAKPLPNTHLGKLMPLPIPKRIWTDVSMDFVGPLPESPRGLNRIMVVVDRFSKMAHYVACRTDENTEELAHRFVERIVSLHGVPRSIVSDRGPEFTSHFMAGICKWAGTAQHCSTAYHPTDGLTERTKRALVETLRSYVNARGNDWDRFLGLAEFAHNNAFNRTIQDTPFRVCYGQHPLSPAQAAMSEDAPAAADTFVKDRLQIVHETTEALRLAQNRMVDYENSKLKDVTYQVGDEVFLSTANLHISTTSRKLLPRFMGPFRVERVINAKAYELELPRHWRVHPVFPVSSLKPYLGNGELAPPQTFTLVGGSEIVYEVDKVLDHRPKAPTRTGLGRKVKELQFLVHWRDQPSANDSWEPFRNLACDKILQEYAIAQQLPADIFTKPINRLPA